MESLAGRRRKKFVTLAKIYVKINFLSLKMGSAKKKMAYHPKLMKNIVKIAKMWVAVTCFIIYAHGKIKND